MWPSLWLAYYGLAPTDISNWRLFDLKIMSHRLRVA